MDYTEYARADAVNWSALKHGRKSMLHYFDAKSAPVVERKPMAIGRAVHTAVFEPDLFPLQYAVYSGPTTGKGSRKALNEWKKANAGMTILTAAEYQRCLKIRDAVRTNPHVKPILEHGQAEHSIFWTDPATGLKCKSRLDWFAGGMFADLKTTADANAERFGVLAHRYGYHCQAAMYREGVRCATGVDPEVFLIVVESARPFDVALVPVGEDELWAGWEEVQRLLQQVAHCTKTGIWPGRYSDPVPLQLPKWSYPSDDEEGLTAEVVEEMSNA